MRGRGRSPKDEIGWWPNRRQTRMDDGTRSVFNPAVPFPSKSFGFLPSSSSSSFSTSSCRRIQYSHDTRYFTTATSSYKLHLTILPTTTSPISPSHHHHPQYRSSVAALLLPNPPPTSTQTPPPAPSRTAECLSSHVESHILSNLQRSYSNNNSNPLSLLHKPRARR